MRADLGTSPGMSLGARPAQVVRQLLAAKANPALRTARGETALDWARGGLGQVPPARARGAGFSPGGWLLSIGSQAHAERRR